MTNIATFRLHTSQLSRILRAHTDFFTEEAKGVFHKEFKLDLTSQLSHILRAHTDFFTEEAEGVVHKEFKLDLILSWT